MIMYLKSSLSLSLIDGCNIGCRYCILSALKNRDKVIIENKSYEEAVEELLHNRYYTKQVPLTINNISDPFATPMAFQNTLGILSELEKRKVENPIIVITKGLLSQSEVQILANIRLKNFFVFYSFSGLAGLLEPLNEEKQLETIKSLSSLDNLTLVHYWRPIIQDVNTEDKVIKRIAAISNKYFAGVIISGLRMNSFIREQFQNAHLPISIEYDADHKIITNETYGRIKEILMQVGTTAIFSKTSCALSYFMHTEDYNGYMHKNNFCNNNCENYSICHRNAKAPLKEMVDSVLKHIERKVPYDIGDHVLHLNGVFTQEELTYVRHSLHFPIGADTVLKSNNNDILSK
ncbi:MAG: hypothetical protein NC131_12065 [Roseburia sp.]|nr:hypothetical protein [Roseburia sp.]